jgi:hypothetical protein
MIRTAHALPLIACLLFTAACASGQASPPTTCDGRHRRPANPYGSVLQPGPKPVAGKATPERHADADPSLKPCGGRA